MTELTPEQRNEYAAVIRQQANHIFAGIDQIINEIIIEVSNPRWNHPNGTYFQKTIVINRGDVNIDIVTTVSLPGHKEYLEKTLSTIREQMPDGAYDEDDPWDI